MTRADIALNRYQLACIRSRPLLGIFHRGNQGRGTVVGRTTTQNFALSPGAVSETVEVTGTAPLVDQTKTDVSTNITPQQITDLPLIGRDIADLAYLSPGVKAADSYDPDEEPLLHPFSER